MNGETHESDNYNSAIEESSKASKKFGCIEGAAFGLMNGSLTMMYGVAFWIGAIFIDNKVSNEWKDRYYNLEDVMTAFWGVMTGFFMISALGPPMNLVEKGRVSCKDIYDILDIEPKVNQNEENKNAVLKDGEIIFENVNFSYPSRSNVKILNGLNLKIPQGKKVAFVGETGSGKSTVMQLIERFYDPDEGCVKFDNTDIKNYNLTELRKSIGYVGQEPVLFAMSIRENLLLGKPDASEEE